MSLRCLSYATRLVRDVAHASTRLEHGPAQGIRLTVEMNGTAHQLAGKGNGPIDAAAHALRSIGIDLQVRSYEERSMGSSVKGGDAKACAFMEVTHPGGGQECNGVGMNANIVTASIRALVSGANRSRVNCSLANETRAA